MARVVPGLTPEERQALLGLWSIPGVGPRALQTLRTQVGPLAGLLAVPLREWTPGLSLNAAVRTRLEAYDTLAELAGHLLERVEAGQMGVCFPGDDAFPPGLVGLEDAPPLLFYRGRAGPPRRRVAMVGSRHPDPGFLPWARRFAAEVARAGVGVVSGAAEGVDRAAHWGALDAGEQTWAFLGSALDELDPAQAKLAPHILEGGGTLYSELPPGVRASPVTFPRRNRLISGASDVVLVMRAGDGSGSLYTAHAARLQGRQVLALPGEVDNPAARGTNGLIRTGAARLCLGAGDVWQALGLAVQSLERPPQPREGAGQLSEAAQQAYALLARSPQPFEAVLARAQMDSAALTSALCELELRGLVVQHPGKRYEKV